MASYSLSGSGVQALTAGTTALHVTITTLPARGRQGRANPTNYFDVALLRFGDGTGFLEEIPVTGGPQWLGVPTGTTQLGYACLTGAVLTVAEVLGGVPPFGYVQPAAAPPGGRHVSGLSFNTTLPVSSSMTTLVSYTVPAGRSALLEAIYVGVGLSSTNATVVVNIVFAGDTVYYNNLNGPLQGPQATGYYPLMQGVGNLHMNAAEQVSISAQNLSASNQVGTIGSLVILEYPQAMW